MTDVILASVVTLCIIGMFTFADHVKADYQKREAACYVDGFVWNNDRHRCEHPHYNYLEVQGWQHD